ncbi:trypsin-like serine protease with C-terminal PDZ domain [Rivularia sp. PCC 7116]|uniref:serine protease n=1 Tax=Rivularia sp. PCC 7116 TaxID=373994 RepID=UPI00029ECCDC|nr:serine protease [Rivularia sp. PCC 7116]AFY58176.1 trypsin-like serine protease with C-terminal PDZ domain [Rivularia sp. PCC 7116]
MKPHRTYFRQSLALIACMGSLLMLPMAESLSISHGKVSAQQPTPQLSPQQIKQLAQSITVKVSSGNNGGSGILLKKSGGVYTVLTNRHVLEPGKPIKLQTSDGKTHRGKVVQGVDFQGKDLIQLQFSSNEKYKVAELGNLATVAINETIYAGGFPFETNPSETQGFVLTTGQVLLIAERALKEGYQIGYDNDIRKGMSGGPILNRYGQLIGINGIHAHPLWGNPYVYEDGSNPTEARRDLMSRYSWGIPILTATSLASKSDSTKAQVPVSKLPPIANEVNNIAEKITVRIDVPNSPECSGSGVIIAKKQNTYTVLTAEHVIREDVKCDRRVLSLVTHDNRSYPIQVNDNSVKTAPGSDLALLEFNSNQTYDVATLADYQQGQNIGFVFISGWIGSESNSSSPQREFTAGFLTPKELGLFLAKNPLSLEYGYSLFYTNMTHKGMSGGPVLDTRGRVIGIHGKAEKQEIKDKAGRNRLIPLGFSLGIPMSKFVSWAQQVGITSVLRVETSVPPALTKKERNDIRQALLQVKKLGDNADAIDWLNYGWEVFLSNGSESEAIKAVDRAIQNKPDFYQAWYLRGLMNGLDKKSLKDFEKAISIEPKFTPAWRIRGFTLFHLDQYPEALSSFEQLVKIDSKDVSANTFRSLILLSQGNFTEALDIANLAFANSRNPDAWMYLVRAFALVANGDSKRAMANLDEAVRLNPEFMKGYVYSTRGNLRSQQGDLKGALADFNEAVLFEPEKVDYLKKRADIRSQLKDYKGAIADYTEAVRLNPKDSDAIKKLLVIRIEQKDFNGAITDLNKFISLNPKNIDAIKARGVVRFAQKDYENALADFNEVIRLKPDDSDSYYYRGQTLTQLNNYQAAVENYNQILHTEKFDGVIGINVEINSKTKVATVTQVKDNYSAQKQGIKVGDQILVVDGKSTKNMSLKQVVDLLRGKAGTKLSVRVARSGNNKLDFNLTRIELATTDIDAKFAKVYYQRGLTRIKLKDNQGARKDLQIAAELYNREGKKNEYQQALAKIKELQ